MMLYGNCYSVVEVLIKRDEQLALSPGGPHNFTPLHLAVINGWTAIAGLLVNQVNKIIFFTAVIGSHLAIKLLCVRASALS